MVVSWFILRALFSRSRSRPAGAATPRFHSRQQTRAQLFMRNLPVCLPLPPIGFKSQKGGKRRDGVQSRGNEYLVKYPSHQISLQFVKKEAEKLIDI